MKIELRGLHCWRLGGLEAWRLGGFVRLLVLFCFVLLDTFLLLARLLDLIYMNVMESIDIIVKIM